MRFQRTQPAIYTVEDVRLHLRSFEIADGLRLINRRSRWLYFERPWQGSEGVAMGRGWTLTEWDLAFMAKQLILASKDFRQQRLSENVTAFQHALFLIGNMRDPVLNGDPAVTNQQRLDSLVRIAHQQFRHQGWTRNAIVRTYLLYERVWRDLPLEFDLESAAAAVYWMPVKTFLALGTCVFAQAGAPEIGCFTPESIVVGDDPKLAKIRALGDKDTLQRFWRLVATDYAGFRQLCAMWDRHPAYARFEFNPLEVRPAIHLQNPRGYCAVPSISSLLLRFTDGIYHDFFNHYNALGNHRQFSAFFGKMFERYVGWQLREHYGNDRVLAARTYRVGKREWDGPDWIVVEGESAILIECRASRLVLTAKVQADHDALAQDVRTKLLDMLVHFPQKTGHIRELPNVWPELQGVRNFYYVVVTLDPWWPAEIFHQVINQELQQRDILPYPYHIISIDTLEQLVTLAAAGVPISRVLQERIDQGQQGYTFDRSLASWHPSGESLRNRVIDEGLDQLFELVMPEGHTWEHRSVPA